MQRYWREQHSIGGLTWFCFRGARTVDWLKQQTQCWTRLTKPSPVVLTICLLPTFFPAFHAMLPSLSIMDSAPCRERKRGPCIAWQLPLVCVATPEFPPPQLWITVITSSSPSSVAQTIVSLSALSCAWPKTPTSQLRSST